MPKDNHHLHIGILIYGCGHHQAAWQHPDSSIERVGDVTYYQHLAQLSEKGLFDVVFFADNQSFNPGFTTMPSFWFDPLINLTAISQVTQQVGLVPTISSTFSNPFTVARQLLSLDHITGGRVGWNLVTSMTDLEAQNHSMPALPDHAIRYEKADEFAHVMNGLFESWSTDDFQPNREQGTLIDNSNIQPLQHKGKYFQVHGPLTTPQSPQGKPVAMQAGASKQGIALATKYADAVYSVSWNIKQARRYRERLDAEMAKNTVNPRYIKVFPGLVTYVGRTHEEALEKKAKLDGLLSVETALKQLSFFVQQDCSGWALDEPLPDLPPVEEFSGPVGRYETILEMINDTQPTVHELLGYLNAGGGHLTLIGTPEEIVDEMEYWFNEGVADGFNLMPPSLPHSLEDFVELIVPELQRRGLYRTEYSSHTLREHLGLN
ncbi:LLM class flavin-dependent oxidoreductase [Staphylococcus caledonicus]|uniref:LLM class flavin-dependent oxidoreductase n=1 Tax=Staphylococcus caledonicus TaxID=2741333 RepID=UPI0018E4B749|nr:LLM class flavin-dependent oxidoreductase [Staphylococcus caledonicus]MBI5973014.1 LLM class flavin-dependent oxidoreductase [Staphylococcus caledonicus]